MRYIFYSAALFATAALPLFGAGNSPYIHTVFEYCPAPGQFVNELPEYTEGDTYEDMLSKAADELCGDRMPGMITLGAYGGYVVFGFDHPVVNVPGVYDFKIYGNAYISDRDNRGGSSEPGIVMVSADTNGNGLPDDPWYELAGSEYSKPSTMHGYQMTYYAPGDGHVADPDPDYSFITDRTYIRWTSNDEDAPEGYVMRNKQHTQSYWPGWVTEASMRFSGARLADNYIETSGNGTYFVLTFYDWGYADNLPNNEDRGFNIEWAVDEDGNPVMLDKIDFVKVYTGVNQYCGWLGESSTEVSGAEDLHPDTGSVAGAAADTELLAVIYCDSSVLHVRTSAGTMPYDIYTVSGCLAARGMLHNGHNMIGVETLPKGMYVLRAGSRTLKFMK